MKFTKRFTAGLAIGAFLAFAASSRADENGEYKAGVVAKVILKTTRTSSGDPIRYISTDKPEVTALTVDFPPGSETGWHLHNVPVYSWVVAGSVTVELEGGVMKTFREGDAIVEMVGRRHNGRNVGTVPARLVVFYTGVEGEPIVQRTP